MTSTRREFLCGIAATTAVSAFGWSIESFADPPPETKRIRIQDAPIACFAPLFISEPLLKAEGFEQVEYVKTSLNEGPAQALKERQVDIGQDDTANYVMHLDRGSPIVILGGVHTGCWELFAQKTIRSLIDLKGKTIAAPEKSSRQAFVAAMIASVGLDPKRDVTWINHAPEISMQLFIEGKIDALMGFVPEPQELRARNVGHVLIATETDRPWSQYFCCLAASTRDFVNKNPVATKRALRAILKAVDLCVSEPNRAADAMFAKGVASNREYLRQAVKEIGYRKWRDYAPDDTMRFWSLRLRELGFIKSDPNKLLAQGTDWRFIDQLRRELKA